MNTEKRASIVQEELMSLYGAPPIPLVHRDAYTLLVAVLLSAQCTDKRVNLVTPALFALASTPEEMARQDVAAVREIVRPCGKEGIRHREPQPHPGGKIQGEGSLRLCCSGVSSGGGA